jgi:hypothetical protein
MSTDVPTTASRAGFRAAGDASSLLAASGGLPAVLLVVDTHADAISIRCAGLDPATVPRILQLVARLTGEAA